MPWCLRDVEIEEVAETLEVLYGLVKDVGNPDLVTFFLDFPIDVDAVLMDLVFGKDVVDIEEPLVLVAVEVVVVNLEQQPEPATGIEAELEFVGGDKGQAKGESEKAAGFQGRHFFVDGVSHVFFRQPMFENYAGDEVFDRGHANGHDSDAVFCLKGVFGALTDEMIADADGIAVGELRVEGRLLTTSVVVVDDVIVHQGCEVEQFYEHTIPFGGFDVGVDFFGHQQRDYGADTFGIFAQQDVVGDLNHLTKHGVE